MTSYFEKKLLELLPPLYQIEDETGDLASFLKVPAISLDEFKELIERFPDIFDVDRCEPRYLPYLAHLVGRGYDGTIAPAPQRQDIKEAVPRYRRKATLPGMRRSLVELGWQGDVRETYPKALRLNRPPLLNASKLPGQRFSLGAYEIACRTQTPRIRETLPFQQPAGTRAWFLQWLLAHHDLSQELTGLDKVLVRRLILAHLDESFTLNHAALGKCFHLNYKQRTWSFLMTGMTAGLITGFDTAFTCFRVWHGRGNRMRLNRKALNTRMLANTWESERKRSLYCEVDTDRQAQRRAKQARLTTQARLGWATLTRDPDACRILFRQKDCYGETAPLAPSAPGEGLRVRRTTALSLDACWRTNRSRLNRKHRSATGLTQLLTTLNWAAMPTRACDVVARYRTYGARFRLNTDKLSAARITNSTPNGDVACFELEVDTSLAQIPPPLRLNERPLNRTALHLCRSHTWPLRLGKAALNQAGFRPSINALRWRFRQIDFCEITQAHAQENLGMALYRT